MRLLSVLGLAPLAISSLCAASSSWSFKDATLSVGAKGEEPVKQKLSPNTPVSSPIVLTASSVLKLALTATENDAAKQPHQAFLTLQEQDTDLEESFPFAFKSDGKGKVDLTQKDLPVQLLLSSAPLHASIVLASFGSAAPYKLQTFSLDVNSDPNAPNATPASPERYTRKPEIHHIFKDDPRSPPKIISLVFLLAILSALPALLVAWLLLGGNVTHIAAAFGSSPISHTLFVGSIIALEGIFLLYHISWNLFQTIPAAAIFGAVAYVSGSKALTEVQERRLAGKR